MPADRRVRVALVINDLARAGAETQLALLATGLDRDRYDPRIVLIKERNDFAAELATAGIPAVALRRRGPGDMGALVRLRRVLRNMAPDVVHSFLFLANWMSTLTAPPGAALVLSQRCSYEKQLPPVLRRFARWVHGRADRLVVNSAAVAEEERRAGFPAARLSCIPNGALLPDPAPLPTAEARAALGLPRGRVVLSLGQLVPQKGHRTLLEAWPEIHARHPDAVLVLVGAGPERQPLESLANHLGISGSVLFLGFRSPVSPYLRVADLLIHPSFTEGMPNAVLEAMAHGCPVVASAVDGVPELVADTARLVPPGDPAVLASVASTLLSDGREAVRLSQAARARIQSRFSVRAMLTATEDVYREVVAGRRVRD